ncbi:MAG: type II secretion system F family protein [Candidatus Paceibacterota bacterium]
MAKFKYQARTKEGELQTGFVEAVSREIALNTLTGHELFILSLESAEKIHWYHRFLKFFERAKIKDLMIFTRQFATLLESKVPIGTSLRSLYKQTKNPTLKEIISELSSDIDAGLALSQALERQSHIFSNFYISMIRSAEITGRLEESMIFLADYLEKDVIWRFRLKNALIYPIIVIILFLVVAGIMITFVFPQLGPIFQESDVSLPLITKFFLGTGNFIISWWWVVILILFLFIFILIDYFRSPEGKALADELVIRLPIFGNLFKKIYVVRFTESASVLVKGGVPIAQSLEITSHTVGNVIYRDILHEVGEGVRRGELLSNLLSQNEYYFPPLVSQMVAIGENTGRLDETLSKISSFYTREVNDTLDNLLELIQPAIIIIVGIFVGLLFAAVLIPIYNLMQVF